MLSRHLAVLTAAIGLIVLGVGVGILTSKQYRDASPAIEGLLWPDPKSIQAFGVVDQRPVRMRGSGFGRRHEELLGAGAES